MFSLFGKNRQMSKKESHIIIMNVSARAFSLSRHLYFISSVSFVLSMCARAPISRYLFFPAQTQSVKITKVFLVFRIFIDHNP